MRDRFDLHGAVLNKKNTGTVRYNDFLIDGIFYNDNIITHLPQDTYFDSGKHFHPNKYGYRSPEFTKNVDYLFSGCSVTYGEGLDKQDIWFELLMKEVDGSYASVAYSGDSVVGQIFKIFSYIKEFGNPKNIFCLFPNFDRFLIYNNENLLASDHFFRYYDKNEYDRRMLNDPVRRISYLSRLFKNSPSVDDSVTPNFFKKKKIHKPLVANDVITQEITYMYSSQLINILAEYCKSNGINFLWATWSVSGAEIVNEIKNQSHFQEYFDIGSSLWDRSFKKETDTYFVKDVPQDCHQEFNSHPEFHFASDRDRGLEDAHFGFHRHIHYYENFLREMKSRGFNAIK